jgi:hypothetical protein
MGYAAARTEPACERAIGLVPHPQPGQFHHDVPQTRITCFGNALPSLDRAAAPGRRRQPGVGGYLAPIAKVPVKAFKVEHSHEGAAGQVVFSGRCRIRQNGMDARCLASVRHGAIPPRMVFVMAT